MYRLHHLRLLLTCFNVLITGEPFYMLLLRPQQRKSDSTHKDISAPMIEDGAAANIDYLLHKGAIATDFTEDEKRLINGKD